MDFLKYALEASIYLLTFASLAPALHCGWISILEHLVKYTWNLNIKNIRMLAKSSFSSEPNSNYQLSETGPFKSLSTYTLVKTYSVLSDLCFLYINNMGTKMIIFFQNRQLFSAVDNSDWEIVLSFQWETISKLFCMDSLTASITFSTRMHGHAVPQTICVIIGWRRFTQAEENHSTLLPALSPPSPGNAAHVPQNPSATSATGPAHQRFRPQSFSSTASGDLLV